MGGQDVWVLMEEDVDLKRRYKYRTKKIWKLSPNGVTVFVVPRASDSDSLRFLSVGRRRDTNLKGCDLANELPNVMVRRTPCDM